jgi:hypothetical protein
VGSNSTEIAEGLVGEVLIPIFGFILLDFLFLVAASIKLLYYQNIGDDRCYLIFLRHAAFFTVIGVELLFISIIFITHFAIVQSGIALVLMIFLIACGAVVIGISSGAFVAVLCFRHHFASHTSLTILSVISTQIFSHIFSRFSFPTSLLIPDTLNVLARLPHTFPHTSSSPTSFRFPDTLFILIESSTQIFANFSLPLLLCHFADLTTNTEFHPTNLCGRQMDI